MTWTLQWTSHALRDMKKLDRALAQRIRTATGELIKTGRGDFVKVKGTRPPEWRLRIGSHRVFCRLRNDTRQVQILRVRRRDEAY